MPTTHSAPPLRGVHRGRPPTAGLRESILAAAQMIFTRREYHEVLMDDVARASRVGKGTVYRYFPGKRQLYVAVMFEGIDQLYGELRRVVDTPEVPIVKVERIVRCILAHFWDRRFFFALIHRNEHKPDDPDSREWLRRRAELAGLIQSAIEEAVAVGQMREVDSRITTEILLGMLRGANRYRRADDTLDLMVAAVVDVFLCGVGTPAGRRRFGDGNSGRR